MRGVGTVAPDPGRRTVSALLWATAFSTLGSLVVASFSVALWLLDRILAGLIAVFWPDSSVVASTSGRYVTVTALAIALGLVVSAGCAVSLTRLPRASSWAPWLVGLGASTLGFVAAVTAFCAAIGLNPLDLFA